MEVISMKRYFALLIAACFMLCTGCSNKKASRHMYDRVVLIGVDGAGGFFENVETPNFDRIFADGKLIYDMHAIPPTSSAESWGSMFYGVEPTVHGINTYYAPYRRYTNDRLPSIFKLVKQQYPTADVASIVGWEPINYGIIDLEEGIDKYPGDRNQSLGSEEIVSVTEAYFENHSDIKLAFIHFDEVDEAGHEYGWGSPEYDDAIRAVDGAIGAIFDHLTENGFLNNALFIVTTDHGGTDQKIHGGVSREEIRSMFAVKGPGIDSGGGINDMETRDVASIVLYSLGIEQPIEYTGRVPSGIWKGYGGGKRPENVIEMEKSPYRTSISRETPSVDFSKDLQSALIYYNSFDSEEAPGYFNKALNSAEKHCSTDLCWTKELPSLSFAFWVKANSIDGDPAIAANKDWKAGRNKGFAIVHLDSTIKINLGDGSNRSDISFPVPNDYKDGWVHYIFVIDFQSRKVTGYCDFEAMYSDEINPDILFEDYIIDAPIMIGQDGTGGYAYQLDGLLDEFMIFDRELTDADIEELKDRYGVAAE